jgi:hypothetical protein
VRVWISCFMARYIEAYLRDYVAGFYFWIVFLYANITNHGTPHVSALYTFQFYTKGPKLTPLVHPTFPWSSKSQKLNHAKNLLIHRLENRHTDPGQHPRPSEIPVPVSVTSSKRTPTSHAALPPQVDRNLHSVSQNVNRNGAKNAQSTLPPTLEAAHQYLLSKRLMPDRQLITYHNLATALPHLAEAQTSIPKATEEDIRAIAMLLLITDLAERTTSRTRNMRISNSYTHMHFSYPRLPALPPLAAQVVAEYND